MKWIALAEPEGGQFDLNGLPEMSTPGAVARSPDGGALARGTLLTEAHLPDLRAPQTLIGFHSGSGPSEFAFALQATGTGSLMLIISQGQNVYHATLALTAQARPDALRLTFSWDCRAGWARLAAETPDTGATQSITTDAPPALALHDLHAMTTNPNLRIIGKETPFFAISPDIWALGPGPTIGATVPIATPEGYRAAETLRSGDRVLCRTDAPQIILGHIARTVPARGLFRPIRLRAPYFGLKRDIIVSPDQKIIVKGSQVEYLFGKSAALMAARHLQNGIFAAPVTGQTLVRYHQLLLPDHKPLCAAGCAIDSLFIGRMRRAPDRLGDSLLATIPAHHLPEHAQPVHPVLRSYEAVALAMARAA